MQPKAIRRNKVKKTVMYLLAFFIISIVATAIFANRLVEPILRSRLHTLIVEGSDSLYIYQLGNLKTNFFSGNAEVENLHIWVDSNQYKRMEKQDALPSLTIEINLEKGKLRGLSILPLIFGKRIKISEIISTEANVKMSRHLKNTNRPGKSNPLWKAIQPKINSINIGAINLDGIKLLYKNADTAESLKLQFDRCVAQFKNIRIDSVATSDTSRMGFAKEVAMQFYDLKFRTADSAYKMKAEVINYSSAKKSLELKEFKAQPTLEGEDFYKNATYQKTRYLIEIKNAVFANFWLDRFIHNDAIDADSLIIAEPNFSISTDKTLEPTMESKIGRYPHQNLLKAKTKISIKGIRITNATLQYAERARRTEKKGILAFTKMNGIISNVTNTDDLIKSNPNCVAVITSEIFTTGSIQAKFTFPLNATDGEFNAEGSLKNVNASELNKISRPLANIEVNSLNVHSLGFQIQGDNRSAEGAVQMRYNNLSVVFLKTDEETGVTSKKKFLTKLFNKFTIHPSNPEGGVERKATDVLYARVSTTAFFGVVWKTVFFGIQDIMMKTGKYQ